MAGYYDNLENHDGKSVANPVSSNANIYATTAANNAGAATAWQNDYSKQINDLYDKQYAAQLAQIQASYDQTKRQLAEAGEKIPAAYQQQQNALAGDYERNRANMNERMALNGINTGAGSQAALAQNAGYLSNSAQLRQAQADAQAALERELANQEAQYQASISQALAQNDYQRAVALMNEMKDAQNRSLEQAKLLAGYGDFSGYASLYGQDTADNMRSVWLAQNPLYAYYTGNLSADDYYKLTGQRAPGTSSGSSYTPRTTTPPDDGIVRDLPTGATGAGKSYGLYDLLDARTAQEALAAYNRMSDSEWDNLSASQQAQILKRLESFGIK